MTVIIGQNQETELTKEQLLYEPKVRAGWSVGNSLSIVKKQNLTCKIGCAHFDHDNIEVGDCVFFSLARTKCDMLVVLIPSDLSLRLNKKNFKFDLAERCFSLASLSVIDYIVPYDEESPNLILNAINPDILYHGRMQNENTDWANLSNVKKIEIKHPFRERKLIDTIFNGKFFKI